MKSLFLVFIGSLCLSLVAARSIFELHDDEGVVAAAAGGLSKLDSNFSIHVFSASLPTPVKAILKLYLFMDIDKLELPIISTGNTSVSKVFLRQLEKSRTPAWEDKITFSSQAFTAKTQIAIEIWEDQISEDGSFILESFIGGIHLSLDQLALKPYATTLPIANQNHTVGSVFVTHSYDIHKNA